MHILPQSVHVCAHDLVGELICKIQRSVNFNEWMDEFQFSYCLAKCKIDVGSPLHVNWIHFLSHPYKSTVRSQEPCFARKEGKQMHKGIEERQVFGTRCFLVKKSYDSSSKAALPFPPHSHLFIKTSAFGSTEVAEHWKQEWERRLCYWIWCFLPSSHTETTSPFQTGGIAALANCSVLS